MRGLLFDVLGHLLYPFLVRPLIKHNFTVMIENKDTSLHLPAITNGLSRRK